MSEALHRIAMSDIRETFIEAFRDVALEEAARDTGSFVSLTAEGRSTVDSHACEMFDAALAAHDRQVKAEAWDEGYGEPRECCGECPTNRCPWDNYGPGPTNPYRESEEA